MAVERRAEVPIERVTACPYTVPTERPESDGTFAWEETTIVVEVEAGGASGLRFSYTGEAAARVVEKQLATAGALYLLRLSRDRGAAHRIG